MTPVILIYRRHQPKRRRLIAGNKTLPAITIFAGVTTLAIKLLDDNQSALHTLKCFEKIHCVSVYSETILC
jgi:hypothetical protein